MSRSLSGRSLSDLQPDEPMINLTDSSIILQFADCIRNLSITRRQSIWSQNVSLNGSVQSQTRLHQQIDDILLFLIIIYGKERYPEEEERLISKLKMFVASAPFIRLKQYIQQKCFPLLEHEFIHNTDYFAGMIEDYARSQLMYRVSSFTPSESSTFPSLPAMSLDSTVLYNKLEEKMMDLFASKFGELELRINHIEKEVYSIKNILKNELTATPKDRDIESTDHIMEEIQSIKKEMGKITKRSNHKTKGTNHKKSRKSEEESNKKKRARTLSRIPKSPKQKNKNSNSTKKKEKKKKSLNSNKKGAKSKRNKGKRGSAEYTKEQMERKEEFKVWLRDECELSQYLNLFAQNALDNLCIVQCLQLSDLALLGIKNNAHKIKMMQHIQKLKYETTHAQNNRSV